ncbi:MAG: hypothetical protein AB2L21_09960 [Anaerolineaceae bacterium]
MKNKPIVLICVTLASFLFFSSVFASTLGVTTTISDYGSGFSSNGTTESGTSHLGHLSGDQYYTSAWGRWSTPLPQTITTNYAWKVYIPYNSGATDGAVKYTCYNDYEGSSGWPVIVNQENIWGGWVFLGWAYGYGSPMSSYAWMDNSCAAGYGCTTWYEVWWDDAKYKPCRDALNTGDCTSAFN